MSDDKTNTPSVRHNDEPPRGKLHCHDWLGDIPGCMADSDLVEVQFKNTRKGFYRNVNGLDLNIGDIVAVEASPGHDIGSVTLKGQLVRMQMKRAGVKPDTELKRVFRVAKAADLEKYEEAKARENDTMIRSRRIAESLNLNMKIGDVEYQGDGNKAIFYYIADERVDFRQLIKVLAETFKVRIEMKQIGARQEAGRIGGIGPCGRPLCCASWMTSFITVGTAAARFQDISLNPQKLAGQCAKLKCCLNFEVDSYVEALRRFPPRDVRLETRDATYFQFKLDILGGTIMYSTDKNIPANTVTVTSARALQVMEMNKAGEKPESLLPDGEKEPAPGQQYNDILSQDISRFDKKKRKRKGADKKEKPADNIPEPEPKPEKQTKEPKKAKSRQPDKKVDKPAEKKSDIKSEPQPIDSNAAKFANMLLRNKKEKPATPAAVRQDSPESPEQDETGRSRNRNRRGGRGHGGKSDSTTPKGDTPRPDA